MFEFCLFKREQHHPLAEITDCDFSIAREVEYYIGTAVEHLSGSLNVSELITRWSLKCCNTDGRCSGRNKKKALPLRVVDVGAKKPDGTWSPPRLVPSNGRYDHYVTLTYQWGDLDTQFCTTYENYEDLVNFLPTWRLPRTIQDAIVFCRKLGYRYL
jgi:hypothetical protein